jgi:hypothetical protein
MDELLQKLVENELLNEDTKSELQTKIAEKQEEFEAQTREKIEEEVRTELAEKYAKDKEDLIEAADTAITKALESELEELKEDIERFRDLEVEYAEKLQEHREQMAESVKNDMAKLLEGLDAYVDQRLSAELEEFSDSIEEVRKENYGRKILETLGEEYRKMFTDEDNLEEELAAKERKIEEANEQLRNIQEELNAHKRDQKMEEVLESLSGHKREVMAAILEGVPTDKLEEGYRRYIGKVLNEETSATRDSEKDNSVLAEGENANSGENENLSENEELTVATGDRETVTETHDESDDSKSTSQLNEDWKNRLRQLSGIS